MTATDSRRRFVVTAATLALLTLGYGASFIAAQASSPQAKVIKISAKRFEYTPGHLTLKKGQPVILEITSRDVLMGFNLPEFNVRADALPDKVTRVSFVPDKTGTFIFLCDIFCGDKHEEMHGQLTVVA